MQLSRLYSNKPDKFDAIEFNCRDRSDVINVVYGAVTDRKDEKKDSHNLGKTTLVHLIDFLFLKEITGKNISLRPIRSASRALCSILR